MPDTAENNRATARLNVLDPGLPFLASQAAIELDNLLLGCEVELQSVERLAGRLEGSTEQIAETEERKSLMDPATISVLSSAVAASGMSKMQTLADLANEAWRIANDLQSSKSDRDRDKSRVERLRAFCNCLAQSAVAHERSLYDMQSVDRNWS